MEASVILAIVAVLATLVGSLVWVLKFVFEKLLPRIDEGNKIIEKNSHLVEKLGVSTTQNTAATKSADEYLRQRNGRDNEMHAELIKAVQEIPAQIIKTATVTAKAPHETTVDQHVENQTVEKQVIKR